MDISKLPGKTINNLFNAGDIVDFNCLRINGVHILRSDLRAEREQLIHKKMGEWQDEYGKKEPLSKKAQARYEKNL